MKPLNTLALYLALTTAAHAESLVASAVDGGDRYQFTRYTTEISLQNPSSRPVDIAAIVAGRRYDKVLSFPRVVPPGGALPLQVQVDTENDIGTRLHGFEIRFADKSLHSQSVYVRNFGLSILDDVKPVMDFGVVNFGTASPEKSIRLDSREMPDFRIERVLEKPGYIDARVGVDGRTVVLEVRADAAWGLHDDYVKLGLTSPRQSEAWIEVKTDVHGEIVPSANPVELGLVRQGTHQTYLVELRSRNAKPFKLGPITFDRIKAAATSRDCASAAEGCRLIEITVGDDQPTGRLSGIMSIGLPEYARTLQVDLTGLLISQGAKIIPFDSLDKAAPGSPTAGATSVASVAIPDIGNALKSVTAATPLASAKAPLPPPGKGPLLKWQVAHDGSIHGYVIYRGDSADGPFERVNSELIRPSHNGTATSTYAWRDVTAQAGHTYWYAIGMIRTDGMKQDLTGPQKVVAK